MGRTAVMFSLLVDRGLEVASPSPQVTQLIKQTETESSQPTTASCLYFKYLPG